MEGHRGDHAVQQLDKEGKEEKENAGLGGEPSEEARWLADAAIQPDAARATNEVAVRRFAEHERELYV